MSEEEDREETSSERNARRRCAIKTILAKLGGDETGLAGYKSYLSRHVHSSAPLSAIALSGESIVRDFFELEREDKEPQFLSMRSRADLSRLAEAAKTHLVLFFKQARSTHHPTGRYSKGACEPGLPGLGTATSKYYDSRTLGPRKWKKTAFFLLVRAKMSGERGCWDKAVPLRNEGEAAKMGYTPLRSEAKFRLGGDRTKAAAAAAKAPSEKCLLRAILRIIGVAPAATTGDDGSPPLCPLPGAAVEFLSSGEEARFVWDELRARKERITVASHVGSPYFGVGRKGGDKGERFRPLCKIPPPRPTDTRSDLTGFKDRVICLAHPGVAYEGNRVVLKALEAGGRDPTTSALGRPEEARASLPPPAAARRHGRPGMRKWGEKKGQREYYISPCACSICKEEGGSLFNNFPSVPAQRPTRIELPAEEYLSILGWGHEEALAKCWELSFAAMDIESITRPLTSEGGSRLTGDLKAGTGGPESVQQIAVIGHADQITGKEICQYFKVGGDTTAAVYQACAAYLDFLLARQKTAARMKRFLLAPVLKRLASIKAEHAAFAERSQAARGDGEPDARKRRNNGWAGTLFGKLEYKLDALCRRLIVFSFNGRSYDHPLLAPGLVLACKGAVRGCNVKLKKRGNNVTSIVLTGGGVGLVFRDLRELLDKSFSLERFAGMCGLQKKKELFPFTQIRSMADLQKKEFSWDMADWKNDLTGEYPSEERISAIRAGFTDKKFPNVYMYLVYYLEADLLLLLRGCSRLFGMFRSVMGFHCVDGGKYTISSASWYAGQLHLFRSKRPGMYNVQVPCAYAMLRRGALGGVTICARSACDPEERDPAATGINSHLLTKEGAEAQIGGEEELRRHAAKLSGAAAPPLPYSSDRVDAVMEEVELLQGDLAKPLPCEAAATTPSSPRTALQNFILGSLEAVAASEATSGGLTPLDRLRVAGRQPEIGRRLVYADILSMYAAART